MFRRPFPLLPLLSGLLLALPAGPRAAEGLDARAKEEVREIVRQLLREEPELVLEALQVLRERRQRAEAEARVRAVREHREALVDDPDSPVGGNPGGDVTVVEFFDYRCPYCRAAAPMVRGLLANDPQVRFVYKEWPILGPESEYAARMALAVHRLAPERYAELHERLYAEKEIIRESVRRVVAELGLDPDAVERESRSPEVEAELSDVAELADALGISGTPAFVVGDHLVPGLPDPGMLERLVQAVRAAKRGAER